MLGQKLAESRIDRHLIWKGRSHIGFEADHAVPFGVAASIFSTDDSLE
jgi:hypothetical protein